MKLRSMKLRTLFHVMLPLIGVLAFAGNTSAQQPPPAASASAPKTVATVSLKKEFAERKKQLRNIKQVNKWPRKGTEMGQPGQFAVPLTSQECTGLGGVVHASSDPACKRKQVCVAVSGQNIFELCVDEVDKE